MRRWTSEEAEEHLAQLGTYVGDETGAATQNKGTEPEKTGEGADANKEDGITTMAKWLLEEDLEGDGITGTPFPMSQESNDPMSQD